MKVAAVFESGYGKFETCSDNVFLQGPSIDNQDPEDRRVLKILETFSYFAFRRQEDCRTGRSHESSDPTASLAA